LTELPKLRSAFPESIRCQFQCAMLYRRWAFAVFENFDSAYLSQAEQALREAIELLESKSLAAADPPRVSHCLASTHGYLGNLLMRLGRTKEAEAEFRTAVDLYEQRSPEIEREPVEEKEFALDYMRFAYLLATLGRPDEASRLLDKAARATQRMGRDDKSANWIFALAVMRLRLGDKAGYRESCNALAKLVNIAGGTDAPELLPWTCALGPNALDDLNGPLEQAEANVANPPTYAPYFDLTILGGVLYRMGQYDRAVPYLEKSIAEYAGNRPVTTGTVFFPKLFLAMTRWQQGQRDEARRMLDEIQHATERELQSPLKEFQRRAPLEVLCCEAEALIQPKKAVEAVENKERNSNEHK
jgi:tetratricopeptide (TPR) repeat protein